jgi:ankyrin repeat protein
MKKRHLMFAGVLLILLAIRPLSAQSGTPREQHRAPAAPMSLALVNEAIHAIQSAEPGALRRLLANGLDPNARGMLEMPLVSFAARNGSDQAVADLVAAGADVNVADVRGITPLMWAATSRSLATVKTLIHARADTRARDRSGATAGTYARRAAADRRAYILSTGISVRYGRMLPAWLDPVAAYLWDL